MIAADPPEACFNKIENDEEVQGKVVLVNRGRCSFLKKIEYLQSLGAKGVVVANHKSGLLHIPSPPIGGSRQNLPTLPSVMITAQAGQAIRKLLARRSAETNVAQPVTASFHPDSDVAQLWKEISPLLVSSQAWPQELTERKRRYRNLSRIHHPDKPKGSKERFAAIAEAYKRANYDLNPEVQVEYKGIDDYLANA